MKHSGTKDLPGPAHSLKSRIAHKESPASGGPDSRDHSTAKPSREIDSSIAHSSTHRLTPQQRRRLKTLKEKSPIKSKDFPLKLY